MGSDDGVREAVRVIRPYLADLVGPQAGLLDEQIAERLNGAADQEAVVALRALLGGNEDTLWFLREVLRDSPGHRPRTCSPVTTCGRQGAPHLRAGIQRPSRTAGNIADHLTTTSGTALTLHSDSGLHDSPRPADKNLINDAGCVLAGGWQQTGRPMVFHFRTGHCVLAGRPDRVDSPPRWAAHALRADPMAERANDRYPGRGSSGRAARRRRISHPGRETGHSGTAAGGGLLAILDQPAAPTPRRLARQPGS